MHNGSSTLVSKSTICCRQLFAANTVLATKSGLRQLCGWDLAGHFGDESFQAITCTGTDKVTTLNKQEKIHQKHTKTTWTNLP